MKKKTIIRHVKHDLFLLYTFLKFKKRKIFISKLFKKVKQLIKKNIDNVVVHERISKKIKEHFVYKSHQHEEFNDMTNVSIVIKKLLKQLITPTQHIDINNDFLDTSTVKSILSSTTLTASTYIGVPLSTINTKIRGDVLQNFARHVDTVMLKETITNAVKDGASTHEYDYLRGTTRVEVKSGQLCWNKASSQWFVKFRDIKPQLYDELCLVLYTPSALYIFKHNSTGLTTNGKLTPVKGMYLNYNASSTLTDWETALEHIITQIGPVFYKWNFGD